MPSDVLITPASSKIDFTDGANSTKRLNISGTAFSFNSNLNVLSSTSLGSAFKAEGVNGTLFEVIDDLSNSLMSVNTIGGLPVFEVFANNSIIAGQYGVNDFVISGNKVGIGLANPINKLSVSGAVSIGSSYNVAAPSNGLIVQGDVGIGVTSFNYSNANRANLEMYGATDSLIALRSSSGNSYIQKYINDLYINNVTNGALAFFNNGSERWRITSAGVLQSNADQTIQTSTGVLTLATAAGNGNIILSPHGTGNVGIGTASPLTKLDVRSGSITAGTNTSTAGTTIIAGYYTAGALTVLGTEQSSGGPVLGYAVTPSTSGTGAFLSATSIAIPRSAYTQDGGTHRWYIGASQTVAIGSAVTASEVMRINSSGNVGVGTTTVSYKLHVQGDIYARSAVINVNGDLNTLRGNVTTMGYSLTNSPSGTGWITVNTSQNFLSSGDILSQLAYDNYNQQKLFTRYSADYGATWSAWKTIINSDAVSGTTNYVPKFTGTNSIGNSLIFDNGTNVAVGSNAVAYGRLQISATGTSPSLSSTNPTDVSLIISNSDIAYGTMFATYGDGKGALQQRRTNTATYYDFSLQPHGGNVGIGTASAAAKLEVYGVVRITESASGSILQMQAGTSALDFASTFYGGAYRPFTFTNGGSERLRIQSDGNVGIGTTNPSTKLHVVGNADIGDSGTDTGVIIRHGAGSSQYGRLRFYDSNGTNINTIHSFPTAWQGGTFLNSSAGAMNLTGTNGVTFGSWNNVDVAFASGGTNYFKGNVGIGINTPSTVLNIRASAPTSTGTVTTGTNLLIDSNTSNYITFRNTADNGTYAGLTFLDNNTGGYIVFRNYTGDVVGGSDSMIYGTYQDHIFQNGSTEAINSKTETMRIKGNGNVGIGTSSPSSLLHVSKAGNTSGGTILMGLSNDGAAKWSYLVSTQYNSSSNAKGFSLIGGYTDASSNVVAIGGSIYEANPATELQFYTHTAVTHATGGTRRMTINTNGNVGIGYTNPAYLLDVNGVARINGNFNITGGGDLGIFDSDGTGTFYSYMDAGVGYIRIDDGSSANGKLDINNSLLYIQQAGGNVGVGTNNPTSKLHVWNGTVRVSGFQSIAAGPLTFLRSDYNGSAAVQINFLNINPSNGYDSDLGIQLMNTAGSMVDVMRVKGSTGNVGIGVINPLAQLHINEATSGAAALRVDGTNGTLFSVVDDLSDSLMSVNNSAGLPVLEVFADDRVVMGQYGANDFVLRNNKIGVGTNNPNDQLTFAQVDDDAIQIRRRTVSQGGPATGTGISWTWTSATTDTETWAAIRAIFPGNSDSHLTFSTRNTSSVFGERMRIQNDGNVGIAATAPSARLQVGTNSTAASNDNSPIARFGGSGSGSRVYGLTLANTAGAAVNNDSSLSFIVAGNYSATGIISAVIRNTSTAATDLVFTNYNSALFERMRIQFDGNVGIGTSLPSSQLEVGNVNTSGSGITISARYDQSEAFIRFRTGHPNNSNVWETANISATDGGNYNGTLSFRTAVSGQSSPSTKMTILPTGNVGINNTNPVFRLDVNGTSGFRDSMAFGPSIGLISWGSFGGGSGFGMRAESGRPLSLGANGNFDHVVINTSGNVGIGTTGPATKLDVFGPISIRGTKVLSTGFDDFGGLAYDIYGNIRVLRSTSAQGDGMYIGYGGSGGPLRFFSNSGTTEFMTIATSGNIGINSTSPNAKLHIIGATNTDAGIRGGTVHIRDSTASSSPATAGMAGIAFSSAPGTDWAIGKYYSGTTSRFVIKDAGSALGTNLVSIDANGNVGIGIDSPTAKLAVNGVTSVGPSSKLSLIGLDINSGATPTYIKIVTTIPFVSGAADFTVNIKGFAYGSTNAVDLSICWHYYLSTFYNATAKSSGGWAPTIRLSAEGGFVAIVLTAGIYWPKLYVESMYSSSYSNQYSTGWSWVDADATGSPIVTVPYISHFGNNFIKYGDGTVTIKGSDNNSGKADLSVDSGGTATMALSGQYFRVGSTDVNWNMKVQADGYIATWAQSMRFSTDSGTNPITFSTDSVEKMRIAGDGNVGVGTTSPSRKLHVYSSNLSDNTVNPLLLIDGKFTTAGVDSNDIVGIAFRVENSAGGSQTTTCIASSYQGAGNSLLLQPVSGNVGVGTINPSFKFEIGAGSSNVVVAKLTQGYERVRYYGFDLLGYNDGNLWMIGNNATNGLILGSNWDWDAQAGIYYTPGTYGAAGGSLEIGQLTKNNANFTHGNTRFYTNGVERLRIISNGYVGIGASSPTYKLQIGTVGSLADSIRIGTYLVAKNTRQYIGYTRDDSGLFESAGNGDSPSTVLGGVAGIRIVNTTGTLASAYADNSVQLLTHIFNGGSRVALHANYDGNIGIGTSIPAVLLQIGTGSPTSATGGIQFGDDTGTRLYRSASGIITCSGTIAATFSGNLTGNATNVTGTVALANGGSGQNSAQAAMNAFAGAVTSGSYLRGNGTNVVMSTIQAADVPTLNQNTTGSSTFVASLGVLNYDNDRTTKRAGLSHYTGYSTGTNRPTTYDYTLQVTNGTSGWEISMDWIATTGPAIYARSLRDCCQNWSSWVRILDSANYSFAANMNQNVRTTDGVTFAGITGNGQLNINHSTPTAVARLWSGGSTVWSLGVGDASGSYFNISADFGSFTINKTNGYVGIGTTSQTTRLQLGSGTPTASADGIQFGGDTSARIYRSSSAVVSVSNSFAAAGGYIYASNYLQTGNNLIYPSSQSATQRLEVGNAANNAWIDGLTIAPGGNVVVAGTLTESSSIRYKENIETISAPILPKLNNIRTVTYNKKDNPKHIEYGIIAEELNELFPEFVNKNEKGEVESVNYSRLTVILIKAVKELQEEVEKLKNK